MTGWFQEKRMSLNYHLYFIVDCISLHQVLLLVMFAFCVRKKNPQLNTNAPLICSLNSDLALRTRKSLRQRDTGCSSLKSSRKNKRESKQLWPFSRFTVPPRGTHTFCSAPLFNPLIFFFYFCWPLHVEVQGDQTRSIDPRDRRLSPQRCQLLSGILLLLLSFVLLC